MEDSSTVLYPIAAHVVEEEVKPTELPPSIFEATPVVESEPNEAQHLKKRFYSRVENVESYQQYR